MKSRVARAKRRTEGLPLHGIQVIELAEGVIGPLCSLHLAIFGAEVIKIESSSGDWLRRIPPIRGDGGALFDATNRNKKGMKIDFHSDEGRQLVHELLLRADVVVIDRPLTKRWPDLLYEEVANRNPSIIWAEASSFGDDGPQADQGATELTIQMAAGLNRHLGRPDSEAVRAGFDIATLSTAILLFNGVLAALFERNASGNGQRVAVSMLAAMTSMLEWNIASEGNPDEWVGKGLQAYTDEPNYGFILQDRSAYVDFLGDLGAWDRFLIAVDRAELAADPRFGSPALFIRNLSQLRHELADAVRLWHYDDLRRVVVECGGTIVPVTDGAEAVRFADEAQLFRGRSGDLVDRLCKPWAFSDFDLPASEDFLQR